MLWVRLRSSPTFYRNYHQLGIVGHDFHLQVHRVIEVQVYRVAVVWGLVLIRLVHVHQIGKVTILNCKLKKKTS